MLLERDGQLSTLEERLRAASEDHGSIILIGGEAGAGKTSLVREFVRPLGSQAVIGACDPMSTPAPLSPLRDFTEVGDDANIELFAEMLDRFGLAPSPTVMVIEDIHWADQATLDFIRFVGRRVDGHRLLMLCTYRDDEVGLDHPLRTVLGQLARLRSTFRLTVPMLSVDAVRSLAASTTVDPEALHRLTNGNAFFVTEILAADGSPPASVQDAVLARLGDLAGAVARVIETVSIAPRSLDVRRTLALGNRAADIDAAVDSGMLVADGDDLGFRHELARSAVERAIPPARRHGLHRAMLQLLLDEADQDHARLAHHAIQADAPTLIAEHAPVAARAAKASGATREAAALFEAALAHADQFSPQEAAAIGVELGQDLAKLDRPAEARHRFEAAAAYFADVGDDLRQAEALRWVGRACGQLGHPDQALRHSQMAVDVASRQPPSEQLVLALNAVAAQAMLARQIGEGLANAERAARLCDQLGLSAAKLSVEHIQACLVLVGGDSDRGIELLGRSVERASSGPWGNRLMALVNLGSGAGEVRRYEAALDALVEAEALGVATDVDASVAYARAWLARVAFEQGRWDDAVAYASLVDATATNRLGFALLTARGVLGRVRVRRGDPGGVEVLEETLDGFRGHELQYRWSPVAGLAEHHWLLGDRDAMIDTLADPYAEALATDSEWARGELGYWLWKAGQIERPPQRCAAPFAAQMDAEPESAAGLWDRIGSPYEAALARTEGSTESAVEALSVLDGLGAAPLAQRVRADLRSSGVDRIPRGPQPTTQAHPFGLTARQADVLELVVEGLSNGQIAERLYVSKKTVEHHVSAVYAKLGVESRAQAIAAARRTD